MLSWITANLPTMIISAALAVLLGFAVRRIYRTHKQGGCAGCPGCGNGCSHCAGHAAGQKHIR